jgi:ribulose bisphosphate carboxylase small subunit
MPESVETRKRTFTFMVEGNEVTQIAVGEVLSEVDRLAKQHPGRTVRAFDCDGKEVCLHTFLEFPPPRPRR